MQWLLLLWCLAPVECLQPVQDFRYSFVDIRSAAGVPCLLSPPSLAKSSLALLRRARWHPPRHLRRADRFGPRAYQVSDAGALALRSALEGETHEVGDDASRELVSLIRSGALAFDPTYQIHEPLVVDEHYFPPFQTSFVRHLPRGEAAAASAAGGARQTVPRPVIFAEVFAGIGGFRVGLERAASSPPTCALVCEAGPRRGCFDVTSNSESLSDQCSRETHSPYETLKRDDHRGDPN